MATASSFRKLRIVPTISLRLRIRKKGTALMFLLALCAGGEAHYLFAECPMGDRMARFIAVKRDALPMHEWWNMGADDFGVRGDQLFLRVCPHMIERLKSEQISFDMVYEDIDEAHDRRHSHREQRRAESFSDYHDLNEAVEAMRRIASRFPAIAALETIGQSVEGRPIHALRISDKAPTIEPDEPGMVVMGCHHAREWISVEVPLFFADYLVENYRKNGAATRLVNYAELWVIPVLNPDGYAFSTAERENRWWRKNRRNNGDGTFGVDPNRNYSIDFGNDLGSSSLTFSEVYRGPAPFSEPETVAIRRLMADRAYGRGFKTGLSFHNFSQLVMYPNGYTLESVDNIDYYVRLASEMTRRINESHGDRRHDYIWGQPSHILYLASGTFEDWAHHVVDATAFIIELRPASFPFFELPPAEILPTCQENLPAFLYLAEETLIPEIRDADADDDGFVGEDDYCLDSPRGVEVDIIGCAASEQDLDQDGVVNLEDQCRDSPAGQLVDALGCRVPTFLILSISSNVTAPIEVSQRDIDAATGGTAGPQGFTRAYAQPSVIELTAPERNPDGSRFVRWLVSGAPHPDGQRSVAIDATTSVSVNAVFRSPIRVEILGSPRIPDVRKDGLGFTFPYQARIIYDDSEARTVDAPIEWRLIDTSVAAVDADGNLLVFDVPSQTGETRTSLTATVDFGERSLTSDAFPVTIFDAATRQPRCREITLEGADRVESNFVAAYQARLLLDGDLASSIRNEEVRWTVSPASSSNNEGVASVTMPPTSVDGQGTLSTGWTPTDARIVLRAAFLNDDGTSCSTEKPIVIAAGDPADAPVAREVTGQGATMCGTAGTAAMFGLILGLALFRFARTRRDRA